MNSTTPNPSSRFPHAPSLRRGSALLVVLGMLAFIVMSATAFSIYMRQNRLPSSFLRQRSSATLLVKAALARAMEEIDTAIGDAPYPNEWQVKARGGVCDGWLFDGTPYAPKAEESAGSDETVPRNYWRNRVYMGDDDQDGVDATQTVATFPLEGLAYLPPPLVNTVRHWSRRSPSAVWRSLDYDAGRYAFTAINVSDYFDLSTIRANVMRDSSVSNRISIAYRFEKSDHKGWGTAQPGDFDQAMDNFRRNTDKGPLVSLADYNMAMGDSSGRVKSPDKGSLAFVSPFCDYIAKASTSLRPFYGSLDLDLVRQQTFVTGSWHPLASTNGNEIVLSDFAGQDFFVSRSGGAVQPNLSDLQKFAKEKTPYERVQRRLSFPALGALYDYLDVDNVPISLAIPTVERTPMITGVQINPRDFKVNFAHKTETDAAGGGGGGGASVSYEHHSWEFSGLEGTIIADVSAVFPFKRTSDVETGTFSAEVLVKGFLTDSPDAFAKVRLDADFRPTADEWNGNSNRKFDSDAFFVARASQKLTVPGSIKKSEDALIDANGLTLEPQVGAPDKRCVFAFKVKKTEDGTVGEPEDDPEKFGSIPFAYMGADGKAKPVDTKSVSAGSKKLRMVFLVWARIVDQDGKTVDLAPATFTDDKLLNGVDHRIQEDLTGKLCGDGSPVLPLVCGADAELSTATFSMSGGPAAALPCVAEMLSLYCDDPRYNFAPEDWYKTDVKGGIKASDWLNKASASDQDIFQFVSNVGYLQSMGELQFLPWTGAFGSGGGNTNPMDCDYCQNEGRYGSEWRTKGNLANQKYMWRTYWAFGSQRETTNGMYDWGIVDSRGGVSVPPYSSSRDIFMAGLANTPYDWAVAAPDNGYDATKVDTLCFNEHSSSEAPLKWDDLTQIADRMREHFRKGDKYEEWSDWDEEQIFGVLGPDDGIHDVDRKFLYSYWKNCFANNQQLFLVFVRAEPTMMMGGSSNDHTPSQLGAKAVALVWREPQSSIPSSVGENYGTQARVHRMRVLFYHQFE